MHFGRSSVSAILSTRPSQAYDLRVPSPQPDEISGSIHASDNVRVNLLLNSSLASSSHPHGFCPQQSLSPSVMSSSSPPSSTLQSSSPLLSTSSSSSFQSSSVSSSASSFSSSPPSSSFSASSFSPSTFSSVISHPPSASSVQEGSEHKCDTDHSRPRGEDDSDPGQELVFPSPYSTKKRSQVGKMLDMVPVFFDKCIKVVGPVLVALAWSLFFMMFYIYFVHILPFAGISAFSPQGIFTTSVGLWLYLNLLYNYYKAITTHPGRPPPTMHVPANMEMLMKMEQRNIASGKVKGWSKYCKKCVFVKPERSHHCQICGYCVLKMDHHCPWINNCVGHYNYRYFLKFMLYLHVASLFVIIIVGIAWMGKPNKRAVLTHEDGVVLGAVLCLSAYFAILILGGLHTFLVLTNQTTIELYHNRKQTELYQKRGDVYRNPYNLGMLRNFHSVFGAGSSWFTWLLPFVELEIGNGIEFKQFRRQEPIYDVEDPTANRGSNIV